MITSSKFRALRLIAIRLHASSLHATSADNNLNVAEAYRSGKQNQERVTLDHRTSPFVREDLRLGDSKISYVERVLAAKHLKCLGVEQQKTIYDAIDSIEWNSLITEAHIEKALSLLNVPRVTSKTLSDRELAVLISATGRKCSMLTPEERNEFTQRLLKTLERKGFTLGITSRNALLLANYENEVDIDAVNVLKWIEENGLVPNEETFGLLCKVYAKNSDVAGILEIMNHMKDLELKANDHTLESLVYALTKTGKEDKALSVINHLAKDSILEGKLRLSMVLAKVESGISAGIVEVLKDISELQTYPDNFAMQVFDVLLALASNEDIDEFEKVKPIFLSMSRLSNEHRWNVVVYGKIVRCLKKKDEKIGPAVILLDFLGDSEKSDRLKSSLIKQFASRVLKCECASEALRLCSLYQRRSLLPHPLRIYLREIVLNGGGKLHNSLEEQSRSKNILDLEDGLKLQIAAHCSQKLIQRSVEEKCSIFRTIAECLSSVKNASFLDHRDDIVRELFTRPLLEAIGVLPKLLQELFHNSRAQCFVTDELLTFLIERSKISLIQRLLNSSLKYTQPGEFFPYDELNDIIVNSSLNDKKLAVGAQLLNVLFPCILSDISDSAYDESYNRGVDIILGSIMQSDLAKVKFICEIWSREKRIILKSCDKDMLVRSLEKVGHADKAIYLKKLKERTEKKDEKEIDTWNKIRGSFANEIVLLLESGDVKKAYKIWLQRNSLFSIKLEFMLAEKLYYEKLEEQYRTVLVKIGERNRNLTSAAIDGLQSSDTSNERMQFLDDICTDLALGTTIKQQLILNTLVNAFKRSIEENNLVVALELLKKISAINNSVYGQIELIGAAVQQDNASIITEVLQIVQTRHGKASSIFDFSVALLEQQKKDKAKLLIRGNCMHISSAKLNYYVDRELGLGKIDTLIDVFDLFVSEGRADVRDVEQVLRKLFKYLYLRGDLETVEIVREKLISTGLYLSADLAAIIDEGQTESLSSSSEKSAEAYSYSSQKLLLEKINNKK